MLSLCLASVILQPSVKLRLLKNNIGCTKMPIQYSSGCQKPGFEPRPRHTKDVKTGRFALLSLALGINELGNRLGGS